MGKEDPVEFDSSLTWRSNMRGVEYVGDIPWTLSLSLSFVFFSPSGEKAKKSREKNKQKRDHPFWSSMKYHYSHRCFAHLVRWEKTRVCVCVCGCVVLCVWLLLLFFSSTKNGKKKGHNTHTRTTHPPTHTHTHRKSIYSGKPGDNGQFGSLAGAARVLHCNAGVLKCCSV